MAEQGGEREHVTENGVDVREFKGVGEFVANLGVLVANLHSHEGSLLVDALECACEREKERKRRRVRESRRGCVSVCASEREYVMCV